MRRGCRDLLTRSSSQQHTMRFTTSTTPPQHADDVHLPNGRALIRPHLNNTLNVMGRPITHYGLPPSQQHTVIFVLALVA